MQRECFDRLSGVGTLGAVVGQRVPGHAVRPGIDTKGSANRRSFAGVQGGTGASSRRGCGGLTRPDGKRGLVGPPVLRAAGFHFCFWLGGLLGLGLLLGGQDCFHGLTNVAGLARGEFVGQAGVTGQADFDCPGRVVCQDGLRASIFARSVFVSAWENSRCGRVVRSANATNQGCWPTWPNAKQAQTLQNRDVGQLGHVCQHFFKNANGDGPRIRPRRMTVWVLSSASHASELPRPSVTHQRGIDDDRSC